MALFKKKEKNEEETDHQGLTSGDAEDVQAENASGADESGHVKTELVFHPVWELSNQEKYVYMFKHQQLPLLKENQLSINGLKLLQYEDGFVVVAFLRNTLPKAIRFEAITILLLDGDGKALAKKRFELDTIGELPARSCMPWRFLFENKDKLADTIPDEGWSLAFELSQFEGRKHRLDLEESWEKELLPDKKEQLEKIIAGLPALGQNEVNVIGLEAKQTSDGRLVVTVLLRNGSSQEIQFEKLPLAVEDATGEVICHGSFTLQDFKVKPNTTKPWTFIFPKELVLKEAPDLSSWKVYPPQN